MEANMNRKLPSWHRPTDVLIFHISFRNAQAWLQGRETPVANRVLKRLIAGKKA